MSVCSPDRTKVVAATLVRPRQFNVGEAGLPEPDSGQVRVRISGCGLCGSNLPVWEGRPWFRYPLEPGAPGHEAWGTVDKLGDEVTGIEPGCPVAFLSEHGFAAYDVAEQSAVVPLPVDLAGTAFPAEPLACAINVFRRSDIRPGQDVAIVGVGFLGALLVQLCVHAGARVAAWSRRPFALEMARECGAEELHRCAKDSAQMPSHEGRFSCVIEATGAQSGLDLASSLVTTRGRLIIAGYHQDGLRTVNMQQWNWKGIDVINAHERDPQRYVDGMHAAVKAVEEKVLVLEPLLTHEFALDEIDEAFTLAESRPDGFLKAVIRPQERASEGKLP